MTVQSIVLNLRIGRDVPDAQPALTQALRSVEVTQGDEAPSGFQLTFYAEQTDTGAADEAVVQSPDLQPMSFVSLGVTVNGVETPLINGFITHQQWVPSDGNRSSMFVVTGEDASVKMDMIQVSLEYPDMGDANIALFVLEKYRIFDVSPDVQPSLHDVVPLGYVPQQNDTDRKYLQQLAAQNGNVFYLTPSSGFTNNAYWGPPDLSSTPQPALRVNMGPLTNVDSMSVALDALTPYLVYGYELETLTDPYVPVPVVTLGSTRSPSLATEPVLSASKLPTFSVREVRWQGPGMSPAKAVVTAQGMTDLSTDQAVVATGELSVTRYGDVLTAPGIVGLGGIGNQYDGLYYVKQVQHKIDFATGSWQYKQCFTLTREGVGTTTQHI